MIVGSSPSGSPPPAVSLAARHFFAATSRYRGMQFIQLSSGITLAQMCRDLSPAPESLCYGERIGQRYGFARYTLSPVALKASANASTKYSRGAVDRSEKGVLLHGTRDEPVIPEVGIVPVPPRIRFEPERGEHGSVRSHTMNESSAQRSSSIAPGQVFRTIARLTEEQCSEHGRFAV